MKKLFHTAIILLSAMTSAQDMSYIQTTAYKTETSLSITNPTAEQALLNVTYFDRLGRPVQQRAHRQSGTGKDIVKHIEYDASGRQAKDFLPYVSQSATLQYDANAASEVLSFYGSPSIARTGNPDFEATGNPYSEKQFEASPISRVLKQAAPGSIWKLPASSSDPDHTVRMEYLSNTAADNVKLFKATAGTLANGYFTTVLAQQGYYTAGSLYKTVLKDENWTSGNHHTVHEFKNKHGQVVLKRTYGSSITGGIASESWHDTYYVYDQFGNLTFVLPPLSDGSGSAADLNGLCYQYRYDERKRLVEKKDPGKDWEFFIYDSLDRIIATGPAFSPFTDITEPNNIGWVFTKYDVFGRIAYTGWMQANVSSAGRNMLQAARNTQTANLSEAKAASDNTVNGVAFRYTNQAWPTGSSWHILTVSYYDDYNFPGAPTAFAAVEGQPVYYNQSLKPKGLMTGSWTRTLEASATATGELSYTFYDNKARPIRTWSSNHLGGYTQMDAKLDFSGKTLYTVLEHKRAAAGSPFIIREDFAYSAQNRLVSHTHKINSNRIEILSFNTYDELGQLVSKKVGGTDLSGNTPFQKVDYAYNVRGWLKEINKTAALAQPGVPADFFAFRVSYDAPESAQAQFNGNISETYWKTSNDNVLRRHAYQFDTMGRLTSTSYHKPESLSAPDSYRESQTYDKNGNIRKLERFGEYDDAVAAMMIDDLEYAYEPNSNRLSKVTDHTGRYVGFVDDSDGTNDTADDYGYDIKGNIKSDQNKNIEKIVYNHMNLPTRTTFVGGATIDYVYNAAGKKIRKTVTENPRPLKVQEYIDGFDYANGTLEAIPTAEGYVKCAPSVFNYIYNYTDHLGNIRLSYTKNPATQTVSVMEENNYYPLGMSHKNYNMTKRMYDRTGGGLIEFCPDCPIPYLYSYKFNGQELQEELGANLYDMPFRDYDPAIGRWTGIDPVTHYGKSPYNGHDNNPAFWADPSGADVNFFSDGVTADGNDAKMLYAGIVEALQGRSSWFTVSGKVNDFTLAITLPEIPFYLNQNDRTGSGYVMQDWVYRKSGLYEYHFDELSTKQWDKFQRSLDYIGAIPVAGEPFDLINAGISAVRGDGTGAMLSMVSMIPIGGYVATAIKIQRHHIIPKAVYRDAGKAVREAFDLNGGFNLKKIPFPFHGNHPQYNAYVASRLRNLENISEGSIKALQKDLSKMINNAYDNFKATNGAQNLNDYFRQFN